MAILTLDTFLQLYDPDRIEQLASDNSRQFGTNKYNEEIVQSMITLAEGTVKNALSKMYTTIELEADAGVQRIVADLAMYNLEARRPPIAEEVKNLHKLALHMIEQLQNGIAKLTAVSQLLPLGSTEQATEAISTGFFNLTEEEQDLLT
ncbi:hypothetical protein LCGC14_1710230 [marine sediment metagenome]|uniref:Uncharacterized protein n=1 Tax=marine sediment metagenome TaxID=412755 RepID=A0A0F9KFI4_9ZZZZ